MKEHANYAEIEPAISLQYISWRRPKTQSNTYHDGVAGPRGEIDVIRVGRDSTISLLYVARHILTDALDALAGTVGTLNEHELGFKHCLFSEHTYAIRNQ